MKQIGLTVIALVLIVTTALPANAAPKSSVSSGTSFTLMTIPGGGMCC
ncbi:MAG TPA: hypothetical protein VGJ85_07340 [Candidatus Nanopelagicaceae bacterium]